MAYAAGAARRDITPSDQSIEQGDIWLWGYGDGYPQRNVPCTGVKDRIDVRVLCVQDDAGTTIVLVTADLGALDPATTERVRTRLASDHGIPADHVALNVSHTHSAPVFVSMPAWQPGVADARADYIALVEDAIVDAAAEAMSALVPATIEFGRGTTTIAVDRHKVGGDLDRVLDVIRITGVDGAPIAVVGCAACHPTSYDDYRYISADFVGTARDAIEAASGGVAMFVQCYAGTCTPNGVLDTAGVGTLLAAEVGGVLAGPMDLLDGPVDGWLGHADLPLQPIIPGNIDAARADPTNPVRPRWAAWMDTLGVAIPATLPTPLQALRVGTGATAWRLVASAHEVSTDLAPRIRGLWPYARTTVAAYTNSQLSYVPSRAVLQTPLYTNFPFDTPPGNYEGGHAFVWYGHRGPLTLAAEDVYVGAHIDLLDVGWTRIGHATSVVGMASWDGRLYAATSNGKLWWRDPVHEDVAWHDMGHATGVTALAACDGALFATTGAGTLWRRPVHGFDIAWTAIGTGAGIVSMTALGSMLYAATKSGRLLRRDPIAAAAPWQDLGHAQLVAGMASVPGVLIAATTDGNLHWRPPYAGNLPWRRYGRASDVVGMTAIGDDLYVATADGGLWSRPA